MLVVLVAGSVVGRLDTDTVVAGAPLLPLQAANASAAIINVVVLVCFTVLSTCNALDERGDGCRTSGQAVESAGAAHARH
jgi:hypothetical protein